MQTKYWYWMIGTILGIAILASVNSIFVKRHSAITIRVAGWGDVEEAKIQQASVDEFQKLHPDVQVEFVRIPYNDYITKILTQFSSKMAPDVMAINAEQLPA